MTIKRKKKKKEELDASLMGWFLPGVTPPAITNPVGGIDKAVTNYFWRNTWKHMTGDPYSPEPYQYESPLWNDALIAWNEYAFGTGPLQVAAQTPQAYLLYQGGFYGSFRSALFYEMVGATIITATALTILDPGHKWSGGVDETAPGIAFTEGFRSGWKAGPIPWDIPF